MRKNFAKRRIANNLPSTKCLTTKTKLSLDNYYTNQPITIALDKALTPNQNAQRYFKRYQKLKEAVKYLTDLIEGNQGNHSLSWKCGNRPQPSWTGRNRWNPWRIDSKQVLSGRRQSEKIQKRKNQNSIWRAMAKPSSMSDAITFKWRANL